MTYYRNRETGIIQYHPVSGLGESFNADEVGEDAKPIVPLGTPKKEVARRRKLQAKPLTKTTGAPASGDSNTQKDGDQ